MDLAPTGNKVNTVLRGCIDTAMLRASPVNVISAAAISQMERPGRPEDSLAADATGDTLSVNSGRFLA
jgi:hypothetical protein